MYKKEQNCVKYFISCFKSIWVYYNKNSHNVIHTLWLHQGNSVLAQLFFAIFFLTHSFTNTVDKTFYVS